APAFHRMGVLEHLVGLSDAGGVPDVQLQLPAPRLFDEPQEGIRRGPAFLDCHFGPHGAGKEPSRSRFVTSTFTRGSPRNPRVRGSTWRRMTSRILCSETPRARAMRTACHSAPSGERWGSSPEADAVTRSAGTGRGSPGRSFRAPSTAARTAWARDALVG